ncbi:DUF342 domain-containing protein [Escherichia coli]|uniref:DUF342 domain-containing protein n=2 Tax=Escherichia coli TaxID=562 RepID=UPI000AA67A88|nr:DUF342 domain-containing protein [Escherichia coli]
MILSVFITVISGHDKPQPPGCLLDGKAVALPEITVIVNGHVDSLHTELGNIIINGNAGMVKTASGDVSCENVSGNVESMSGNVNCKNVYGGVKTLSGNIYKE